MRTMVVRIRHKYSKKRAFSGLRFFNYVKKLDKGITLY